MDKQVDDNTVSVISATQATLATIHTGNAISSKKLAPFLMPERVGDPLGLGIAPGERPPAPLDPDQDTYSDEEYAKSLLNSEERESINARGPLHIAEVRQLIIDNSTVE